MNGAEMDIITDATFGFIAARAARYPVVVRSSQLRTIRRRPALEPAAGDPGIRWLLLNTQRVNRCIRGTG